MELKGAVAVVTGGGQGIGQAIALLLAQRKAHVVVSGRRQEPLDETVQLIAEGGGRGTAITADVRNSDDVTGLVSAVLGHFRCIDILVNNAGVAHARPVLQTTIDEWNEMIDTNLTGAFLCARAVLPGMLSMRRGVIVNVASVLAQRGSPNFGGYCASKFGLLGLTEVMSDEYREKGIRVLAVCPGRTATAMQRQLGGEEIARLSMPPRHVAESVIRLLTDEASAPSGTVLVVDDQNLGMWWLEQRRSWRGRATRWARPVLAALGLARRARR